MKTNDSVSFVWSKGHFQTDCLILEEEKNIVDLVYLFASPVFFWALTERGAEPGSEHILLNALAHHTAIFMIW